MQIRFWGTRGSIAKPEAAMARYGGNTSCVEVRSDAGTLIVLDCGTGAHALGQRLMAQAGGAIDGHLLVSHTHWDHIQGFPFFAPLYRAGNTWDIYGPKGLSESIRESLSGQMQYTYFPVTLEQFAATLRYHDLVEGRFRAGDFEIAAFYLNHPALTLGYRLYVDGASVVYSCDHEPNAPELGSGQGEITGQDRRYLDFIAGADLVIHDAQYTAHEYPGKIGWGHSSVEYAVRLCEEAGVGQLVITHYDPLREDAEVDRIVAEARAGCARRGSALEVTAAAEGLALQVLGRPGAAAAGRERFPARSAIELDAQRRAILVFAPEAGVRDQLLEAAAAEGLAAEVAHSAQALAEQTARTQASLAVIEHAPPRAEGLEAAQAVRRAEAGREVGMPIVMLAADDALAERGSGAANEWLTRPFSTSYLRTKLRAWALRTACRWVRARLPEDEQRRLATLRELAILDTEPEERFDRVTRIAASAFDVPIALVSLVDAERQWFKSCYGLGARETSRDAAFCAHVVHQRTDLVVSDTLRDERFADNPLVLEDPHIRFYAGAPLIVEDGSCLGTLCLIDTRPRQLGEAQIDMLHDLRDMVLEEIRQRQARRRGRDPA